MNARRLAATETNIAYRTADHLRWQQMDFVVGIEIVLSNNHTIKLQPGETTDDKSQLRKDGTPKANAVRPLVDICDDLAGRYPKDFKFTGWHPHCCCHAVPILKTQKEINEDTRKILNGEPVDGESVNAVKDIPQEFKNWVRRNVSRIETARSKGTEPYFLRDNANAVGGILNSKGPVQPRVLPQNARDLIEHLRMYGNLNESYKGGLTEREIYRKWDSLTVEERLQVLERGRYTGMLSTEEDLDFANLYQSTTRDNMLSALQDELENKRLGYDVEDTNHYIIKFKGNDAVVHSFDLEKPLTAAQIKRVEYISANAGLSNYRYWAANDDAKAALINELGFIEYRRGKITKSWNGKDFLGNDIADKYIGKGLVEKGKNYIISKRFAGLTTHDEVASTLSKYLGKRLGYDVEVIAAPEFIDLETAKAYTTELERLSRQYRLLQGKVATIRLGYHPAEKHEYGAVFYNPDESENKMLSLSKALDIRYHDKAISSSRCYEKALGHSSATHEFGHLLYQFRGCTKGQNYIFESEVQHIYEVYQKEVNELIKIGDMNNLAEIYIGDYGHTKGIGEFLAEAFQEYKNSRYPSKYAIKVGKIIDRWFKR